jgi:hypothetical protein
MDIHEDITVTLPHWKWVYFLGWLDAHAADDESTTMHDVVAEIESNVKP